MRMVISDGRVWSALHIDGVFTYRGIRLDGRFWLVLWKPGEANRIVRSSTVQHLPRRNQ